ncbi:Phosphoribosylaminoimidazole-succinocarboxamide synthase [Candidatus Lokiarchaeum ossiferum]|uniref:Phosphoribosylaminoimidazole-succinocarboxamide synthase n=1 Tax=Candidatus Lokiarchaeum ossiferum TaxID=2951803 RepID=A0ABY6HZH4_9ARCH|nr:Phosphoribosylaminoimidazole-succinocarboxamide synthase [Candidatus Lokiarchaeum sp. B-35]
MIEENIIREQLHNTVEDVDLSGLGKRYKGKVRENFVNEEEGIRTIVATDRLSAFDRVITTIPFKGQLLNQLSTFWFEKTKNIIPNHIIDVPDPNVVRVHECKSLPIEMIVRAYITGSAWRAYQKGESVSGITFPEGLKNYQKLPEPVLTPSTKAAVGEHDLPISREEIIAQGLVSEDIYKDVEEKTKKIFDFATKHCAENNLILVDCKFEYGITPEGKLVVIDEIFTPDASRFWIKDTYEDRFAKGEKPEILDKEFFRQWLITEKNYMGEGPIPEIPDEIKVKFVNTYVKSYEMITGQKFEPVIEGNIMDRIKKNLKI